MRPLKNTWLLLCSLPFFALSQPASFKLEGRVINAANGQPLAGATVQLPGGNTSTFTGAEGYFSLQHHAAKAELRISYIGFNTGTFTLETGRAAVLALVPADAQLETVTVRTGYQQIARERVNGAFEIIDSNLLQRVPAANLLARLDGQAGSIYFNKINNSSKINIRGISSLTAGLQDPLIILDNFPYEGDINSINPNDIDQVTLLKDAAAASIWGARAGNGVIVISTKKGGMHTKPCWRFTGNMGITEKPDLMYLSRMNSSDFIGVEKFLFGKGFYTSAINNTGSRPVLSPVVEWLQQQKLGLLTEAELQARIDGVKTIDIREDFMKWLYQPAMQQQYFLQLTGGGSHNSYAVSAGYDRLRENTVGDRNERVTVRIDNSYRPARSIELEAGLLLLHGMAYNNSPGDYFNMSPGGGKASYYPYARLADDAGNPAVLLKDYRAGYIDTAGRGLLLDWKYRPLEELGQRDNRSSTDRLVGRFGVKLKIVKGLQAELRYQFEKGVADNEYRYSTRLYLTRNLVNRYSQVTGNTVKYNLPNGGILDESHTNDMASQGRGMLSYQWQNTRWQVAALAGAEIRQAAASGSSNRTYGYSDDPISFVNVDYVTSFPIYGNLAGATPIINNNSFSKTLQRFVSVFGNASATWLNRYTVSASARKDGSNLYGVNSNQRTVPLWSGGVGWTLSNEKFYHWNWMNFIKLRATYGVSGNSNTAVTAYTTVRYFPASGNLVNLPYAGVVSPANPDLQWEKVAMLNAGLDFASRNKRVSGSVEYYRKWADHLLADAPLDPTTGFSMASFNSGKLEGKGVEVNLRLVLLRGTVDCTSELCFNYASSRVTKYDIKSAFGNGYVGREASLNPLEGKAPYGIFAYSWAGLDPNTGDPVGYFDGKESTSYTDLATRMPVNELLYYGSARPPFFGFWRNTFSYKGLVLSANITYRLGHYFRQQSISYNSLYSSWIGHADFAKRWQQPGDERYTQVPSMPYPSNSNRDAFYTNASVLVHRADQVKLQDLRLSYRLPAAFTGLKSLGIQVFVYTANVATIWRANSLHLDPDFGGGLPAAKSYTAGLQVDL